MLTALAQINLPSDETIQTLANSRSDTLALLAVLAMIVIGGVAVILIARIVGEGLKEQNRALSSERSERQKLQGILDAQKLRTNALEDRIDKLQAEAAQAQHLATQERERLIARLEMAEKRLREQETAFNDERSKNAETIRRLNDELNTLCTELRAEREGSMALYAENERLRAERDNLAKRVAELERRIDELSAKVDKRATDEQPAVNGNGTPESKIDTAPLENADVQRTLQKDEE